MPIPSWVLQLIQTGASITGNVLSGNAQRGAIGQAGQINQQATQDAMNAILGLYDQGRSDLSPYRQVGVPALNNLQALANRGRAVPPRVNAPPSGNALARFAQPGAFGGGSGGNIGRAISTDAQGRPVNVLAEKAKLGSRNSLLGTAGGLAGAVGIGSLIGGGLPTLGATLAWLGGPVGFGLGLAGSLIGSQFGKHNPDKAAASRGADEMSRQIWGTNTPGTEPTQGLVYDLKQGKISLADAKAKANSLMGEWEQAMRAAGVDEGIIKSSVQTQMQYLQPLKDVFAQYDQQQTAA